jgi:surfactin family lipopeptide synthetase A
MAEACLAVAFPELNKPIESCFINRNSLKKGQKAEFTNNKNDACFVSVGKAVNGCSIKISNRDKAPEGEKIIGEILIKGENIIRHYYGHPESATDKDGWFTTGDLGFIVDGKLVITGRLKDIIFWNGQNVYPNDLEHITEQLEIVGTGKIVFGGSHRHDSGLEEVLAFHQYRGNIQSFVPIAKKIRKQISEKTGIQIKYVIPVRKIPKTTSGKIQRYLLVSEYQEGFYNDVIEQIDSIHSILYPEQEVIPGNDLLEEQLTSIWEEVLEISPIDVQDNFFELGGDSIKAIRIGTKLQEHKFNCPPSLLFEKKTIKEIADFIRSFPDSSQQASGKDENKEISEYSINRFSNEDLEDVFSKK